VIAFPEDDPRGSITRAQRVEAVDRIGIGEDGVEEAAVVAIVLVVDG
jgi:hypothetical protein